MASRLISFLRYWLPTLFVAAVIFYLSNFPGDTFPDFQIPMEDKMVHVVLYAALGFVICRALTAPFRNSPSFIRTRWAMWTTVLLCFAYGLSDEFHQTFVPDRTAEFLDLVADLIGGTLGGFLAIGYRHLVFRLESRRAS